MRYSNLNTVFLERELEPLISTLVPSIFIYGPQIFICSLVTFESISVSYVIPKTFYNTTTNAYYVSVTVCVELLKNAGASKPIVTLPYQS